MSRTGERGEPTELPLERVAETIGAGVIDVFKLLSNEIRLAILLALWEAFDPYRANDAVPFTELRKRVGIRHGTQFPYHLNKLVGQFVRKTDAGYELRPSGRKLVQTVIAGAGIDDRTLDRHETDMACWICGASTEVTYRKGRVYTACTECDGSFEASKTDQVRGTISSFDFDPAGVAHRSPEEIVAASIFRGMQQYVMRMGNLCPVCSGIVESWFDVCEDHRPEPRELCCTCGRKWEIEARWLCTVCKHWGVGPPSSVVIVHPTVVAFYEAHGVEIGYQLNDFDRIKQFWELMTAQEQELVSTDPPRVQVTVRYEGDELRLTVDEDLTVVDRNEED